MDLSIIIPTMNRPSLLLRLVRYYDSVEFKGRILIGDSSRADVFREASHDLECYRSRLDILHYHLPGRSVAAAVMEMNAHLDTPYVCLVPDDDFIVPRAAERCITFLTQHTNYGAAHGRGILVSSVAGDPGTMADVAFYPQTTIAEATASARLSRHLEHYSVSLFSVHRADVWRKMFMNTPLSSRMPQCCDKTLADELLQCCLSVVYGKIGQVDGLYLVRQTHDQRYLLPTWFDWLKSERWHPSYTHFRSQIAQAISTEDGIAPDEAGALIDMSFATYLRRMIANDVPKVDRLREVMRQIPLLRSTWRALREILARVRPEATITLASLMRPSSPYYQDFHPVYRAVTEGTEINAVQATT